MMLVKKEGQLITYGDLNNNDVIPFIDLDKEGYYLVKVTLEHTELKKVSIIKKYKSTSIYANIYKRTLSLYS